MKKIIGYTIASFAIFITIWQLAISLFEYSNALLPSPLSVLQALIELTTGGTLTRSILVSLYRFAAGYLSSVLLGTLFGLLLGSHPIAFRLTNPMIQLIRPIAPVACMPFVVLLLGIGDIPAIVIIFLAGFFPVLLTTSSAVHHIDPIYLKVAQNYGISHRRMLHQIVLPAVFPQIAGSLHIALGTSWIFLVSGEMVGAQSGLGYLIIDSRNNLRTDQLIAVMLVIGIIGFILDLAIGRFEKKIRRMWGEVKQ